VYGTYPIPLKRGVKSVSTLPERYRELPSGPVTIHNFTIQGRSMSQMNEYELKHLSRIKNQAFRYNGKTVTGR
jgi:hypothetical protein